MKEQFARMVAFLGESSQVILSTTALRRPSIISLIARHGRSVSVAAFASALDFPVWACSQPDSHLTSRSQLRRRTGSVCTRSCRGGKRRWRKWEESWEFGSEETMRLVERKGGGNRESLREWERERIDIEKEREVDREIRGKEKS